ncbi:T9SS type A sorting domain-containing protein [Gangjinia marincola]
MGFNSRINEDGLIESYNNSNPYYQGDASPFDLLLMDNDDNVNFLDVTPLGLFSTPNVDAQDFLIGCSQPNTIEGVFSNSEKLYSSDDDQQWNEGTSLSHITDQCNSSNAVMTPAINPGEYNRITQNEIDILKSMHYRTMSIYGTQNLLTGGTNPNYRNNLVPSSNNLVAMSDPCHLSPLSLIDDPLEYVDKCGIHTLSYDLLLANDIYDGIIPNVVNMSFIDNFGSITQHSSSFDVTVDSSVDVGKLLTLSYQLQQPGGQLSNIAYAKIKVVACTDYSNTFNCSDNTESDNLICSYYIGNNINAELNDRNGGYIEAINGFYPASSSVGVSSNQSEFPNSPLINFFNLQNNFGYRPGFIFKLKSQTIQETKYLLSFFNREASSSFDATLALTNLNQTIFPQVVTNAQDIASTNDRFTIPHSNFIGPSIPISKQHVLSFTTPPTESYDSFYLQVNNNPTQTSWFQLVEDNFDDIPSFYSANCNDTSQTIGIELADIAGVNYSWYEVDDSGTSTNYIQLTDGVNDLNNNDGISSVGNGSQLTINVANNYREFQLRRTFNGYDSPTQANLLDVQKQPGVDRSIDVIVEVCCDVCDEDSANAIIANISSNLTQITNCTIQTRLDLETCYDAVRINWVNYNESDVIFSNQTISRTFSPNNSQNLTVQIQVFNNFELCSEGLLLSYPFSCNETERITIYPNPVFDTFTINSERSNILYSSFKVKDINGNIVYENTINKKDQSYNINFLKKGIYFLELRNTEGNNAMQKIIKL